MNEKSQQRKIKRFLRGNNSNQDIDSFCLYQWLERCHFHHWWDLGISLGSQIPTGALNQEYCKRLDFLLAECRRNHSEAQSAYSGPKIGMKDPYPYRTKLAVSPAEALRLLRGIHHNKFLKVLDRSWQVNDGGFVRAQSVLWLFCWSKTGNGSRKTAEAAKSVFDMIIPISYEALNSKISHGWAQNMRYTNENIELAFEDICR